MPPDLGAGKSLYLETAIQIHEFSLWVKNCDKRSDPIISPFLTTWKIGIVISIVHMSKMMLAKLELDFKPKSCLFSCYFYGTVLSFTILCCLLCPHLTSDFLIPEISHLLLLVTSLTQSVAKGIQVTIVYCVLTV